MDALLPADPDRVGPYLLEGRLGAGGMGEVFLGRSPGGRRVAVKLIRREHAANPQFRRRFAREVEAARQVGGFHAAQVIDADPEAESPWLVTAYIPGRSLREVITGDGPLTPEEVLALGAGLAEGLAAIHACGLVHRDLKPSNVITSGGDGPHIIDFGIARSVDASSLTSAGVVIGTFAFMSPEQVRADRADAAGDVFSLGTVLAFAATGRGPFDAETIPAIVHRILNEAPDLGELLGTLRNTIEACLTKDPEDRPDVAEVLAMLVPATGRTQTSEASEVPVPDVPLALPEWSTVTAPRRATLPGDHPTPQGPSRRKVLGLAGGALALVGGGLIAATQRGSKGLGNGMPPTRRSGKQPGPSGRAVASRMSPRSSHTPTVCSAWATSPSPAWRAMPSGTWTPKEAPPGSCRCRTSPSFGRGEPARAWFTEARSTHPDRCRGSRAWHPGLVGEARRPDALHRLDIRHQERAPLRHQHHD
ncbi:serine/threonine-protein kinase [Streptomyces sp. NBC_00057]|uniref:serine/threonine-protein kinase n=1 Tax=Streptomyces sp. NBC_00057 TaxID=2975634 RepID=UPI003249EE76